MIKIFGLFVKQLRAMEIGPNWHTLILGHGHILESLCLLLEEKQRLTLDLKVLAIPFKHSLRLVS